MMNLNNKPPFFILGAQRSGTTMLRLMLNNHPNLAVPHETGFIVPFYQNLSSYSPISDKKNLERLIDDISEFHHVKKGNLITDKSKICSYPIDSYSELVNAIMLECAYKSGKTRWGDKTPSYTSEFDVLWKIFPNCKYIHLVRDGRDVVLSQRRVSWGSKSMPRLAEEWQWKTTICHKIGSVLPDSCFLEIKYEDLVLKTQETLKQICDFLEEPYADSLLEYHKTAKSSVPSESLQWHRNSIKPPDPSKLYEWKNKLSLADRIIFEQVAGPTLELFGYEREHRSSNLISKIKNVYYANIVRW